MKIRYLRQSDTYSCGPVALINALKWTGIKATSRHMEHAKKICEARSLREDDDWVGTVPGNLSLAIVKVLRKKLNIQWILQPVYHQVRDHIRAGNAAIILYAAYPQEYHYAFFYWDGQSIVGVNHHIKRTEVKLTGDQFKAILRKGKIHGSLYPEVWLFEKPKESSGS